MVLESERQCVIWQRPAPVYAFIGSRAPCSRISEDMYWRPRARAHDSRSALLPSASPFSEKLKINRNMTITLSLFIAEREWWRREPSWTPGFHWNKIYFTYSFTVVGKRRSIKLDCIAKQSKICSKTKGLSALLSSRWCCCPLVFRRFVATFCVATVSAGNLNVAIHTPLTAPWLTSPTTLSRCAWTASKDGARARNASTFTHPRICRYGWFNCMLCCLSLAVAKIIMAISSAWQVCLIVLAISRPPVTRGLPQQRASFSMLPVTWFRRFVTLTFPPSAAAVSERASNPHSNRCGSILIVLYDSLQAKIRAVQNPAAASFLPSLAHGTLTAAAAAQPTVMVGLDRACGRGFAQSAASFISATAWRVPETLLIAVVAFEAK